MSLNELYRAEELPIFQNRMFDTSDAARACARGDVVLVRDSETGLIFNNAFDPAIMDYDAAYQNEQAVSGVFREHLGEVTSIIRKHLEGEKLIEVGCGKGYYLELLRADGFEITGLDPTYEGQDPDIIKEYFTAETGLRAPGIVLRHVLEHIRDPASFLADIRDANGGSGLIYIEVPCFDWICKNRTWFDIFYEHVNYFRLSDFDRIFGRVAESGHVFGGQYLYIVGDLSTVRKPQLGSKDDFAFPDDFMASYEHSVALVRDVKSRGQLKTVVWGGASKGTIFSLRMERAGLPIDTVIDINPAKQGQYLPATGLRVSSPDEVVDTLPDGSLIFVMNPNYLDEIREMTHNRFHYILVQHESI